MYAHAVRKKRDNKNKIIVSTVSRRRLHRVMYAAAAERRKDEAIYECLSQIIKIITLSNELINTAKKIKS